MKQDIPMHQDWTEDADVDFEVFTAFLEQQSERSFVAYCQSKGLSEPGQKPCVADVELKDDIIKNVDLSNVRLPGAKFTHCSFKGINAEWIDFDQGTFFNVNLMNMNARGAYCDNSKFSHVSFSGSNLMDSTFADTFFDEECIFTDAIVINARGINLDDPLFKDAVKTPEELCARIEEGIPEKWAYPYRVALETLLNPPQLEPKGEEEEKETEEVKGLDEMTRLRAEQALESIKKRYPYSALPPAERAQLVKAVGRAVPGVRFLAHNDLAPLADPEFSLPPEMRAHAAMLEMLGSAPITERQAYRVVLALGQRGVLTSVGEEDQEKAKRTIRHTIERALDNNSLPQQEVTEEEGKRRVGHNAAFLSALGAIGQYLEKCGDLSKEERLAEADAILSREFGGLEEGDISAAENLKRLGYAGAPLEELPKRQEEDRYQAMETDATAWAERVGEKRKRSGEKESEAPAAPPTEGKGKEKEKEKESQQTEQPSKKPKISPETIRGQQKEGEKKGRNL